MRLLGFDLSVKRAVPPGAQLISGDRGRWWWPIVREPFTGAWQRNSELRAESVLAMYAVYACIERIASDVGKCRLKLVEKDENDIWTEADSAAFAPVLRKPNHYQTRIQFFENWIVSKVTTGNTYSLKARDERRVVTALYLLDPLRVKVLVTPSGDVYYELNEDYLADLHPNRDAGGGGIVVPASEIIHDMCTIKFHPLCGVPPLIAAAGPAGQSLNIEKNSTTFFRNNSTPGGLLTAPGEIKEATAKRLKEYWQTEFSGDNAGKIAVLGDGLKFEPMATTAQSSQLVEQLGLGAKMVCSAFGVPAYMVGVGDPPAYNNIEALNTQYYTQCLQKYFEAIELLCDEGLGLVDTPKRWLGTEFELDDLLRMDTMALIESIDKAVKAGAMKPNEGRKKLNYGPVEGGDACYLQQQNFSLAALAKRDAKEDPFAKVAPPGAPQLPKPADGGDGADEEAASMEDTPMIEVYRAALRLQIESRAVA
jgi:HK97 family phage portal protein